MQAAYCAAAQQYVFHRGDFPLGGSPGNLTIADFNGDKQPDLAVTVRLTDGSSAISILLGRKDGSFAPHFEIPLRQALVAISAHDFNNDGKADLAVLDSLAGAVWILPGNGDGTFATALQSATGSGPTNMAVGDFNRDGRLDVAVVDQNCTPRSCPPGMVSILIGKGDGTFQPKTDYPIGTEPFGIAAQDFNGDGKLDLAVANQSTKTISILLGNGDGTFKASTDVPSANGPTLLLAADFDGDNIPDLVVTYSASSLVSFRKGNGDGTFQTDKQISSLLSTFIGAVVDINGDGKMDLAFTAGSGIVIFLGNGDGTFQPWGSYTSGGSPSTIAIQDVNGDALPDLITTDQYANTAIVFLGDGGGTFSPRRDLPLDPTPSAPGLVPWIADLNGDGIPDVIAGKGEAGEISVLLGKGNGQFQPPVITTVGLFNWMVIGDFDGDGHPDAVLDLSSGIAVLKGLGNGSFGSKSAPITIASPVRGWVAGDFNRDGKLDLAILANGFLQTNPVYVFLGKGDGTFNNGRQSWNLTSIPMAIAAGDFNRDGNLDLVVAVNPNGIGVMLGDGGGGFLPPVIYPTDTLPGGLTVADLNGDGAPDVIATGDKVDVFLGKGDGTFSDRIDLDGGGFPRMVAAGDFNGDGVLDIVALAEGPIVTDVLGFLSGNLEILLGNPDGTYRPRVEIASGYFLSQLLAGDLNLDGTADVIVGGSVFMSGPVVTLHPSGLDFGTVTAGASSTTQNVILKNDGDAPLQLDNAATTGPFGLNNPCGHSITPGAACTLAVTFTPQTAGPASGVLSLADNGLLSPQRVALAGTGQADFSLSATSGSSTSATVTAGGTASYTLSLAPAGGFSQSISLTCSGTPATTACTISPASVTLNGTSSTPVMVSVTTKATTGALSLPGSEWQRPTQWLALLVVPFGLFLAKRDQRLTRARLITLALIAFLSIATVSCGGGTSSSPSTPTMPVGTPGTPTGSYTFVVTATSGTGASQISHSMQLSLIVK